MCWTSIPAVSSARNNRPRMAAPPLQRRRHGPCSGCGNAALVLRRLLTAIPTLFVIVTISFFLMRVAPGGPFNQEKGLNPVIKANLEKRLSPRSAAVAAVPHLSRAICCTAISAQATVCPISPWRKNSPRACRYPLSLAATALVLALLFGCALGIIAALHQNQLARLFGDRHRNGGQHHSDFRHRAAVPAVLCPDAEMVSGRRLGRRRARQQDRADRHAVLPQIAIVARLMRGSMIESLRSHHIRTARALGLSDYSVIIRHALARRVVADHLLCRPRRGGVAHRFDHRRNHLCHSRRRPLIRRCRAQPRLHAGDGHGGGHRHLHHRLQSHRRYALCRGRSAGAL